MKAISLAAFMWVLVQMPVLAQWRTAATPPPIAVGTPIPMMSATLKALNPRQNVDLEIAPKLRKTFRLARALVVVGTDGKLVKPSAVNPGGKVTVHFMQDGNEIIIDRIFLQ
jgi:hypothetical protein